MSKFGHFFYLYDGLLYFKDNDNKNQLIIFFDLILEFLQNIYDNKHHFGKNCMLQNLKRLHFRNRIYRICKYLKSYYLYRANRTDNVLFVESFQSIQLSLQSIYTICLDFVITLFIISFQVILQVIENYDVYDAMFNATYKILKRKLLFLKNKRYVVEDWGYVFGRQLLLND